MGKWVKVRRAMGLKVFMGCETRRSKARMRTLPGTPAVLTAVTLPPQASVFSSVKWSSLSLLLCGDVGEIRHENPKQSPVPTPERT